MADAVIQLKDPQGDAVCGAAVLAAYPDGRYLTGETDAKGEWQLSLYRADFEMRLLVAAEGYLPLHTTISPESRIVPLELNPSKDERRALLFTRSTGYIPGITGRINPHKDGYVYADNIAINGRLAHPAASFEIGTTLDLIDVYGVETSIKFLVVEGQFSLIEYTEPKAYGGQ